MTDAFAEMGLERRPLLDPAAVQSRYLELAPSRHPDRLGGDPAPLTRLNEARRILSSPPARLRHLLDLTFPGAASPTECSPDFELFSLVGNLTSSAESLAEKRERAGSALALALLKSETLALEKSLASASKKMAGLREKIEATIRHANDRWPDVVPQDLARLAGESAFCDRWTESLRRAGVKLLGG